MPLLPILVQMFTQSRHMKSWGLLVTNCAPAVETELMLSRKSELQIAVERLDIKIGAVEAQFMDTKLKLNYQRELNALLNIGREVIHYYWEEQNAKTNSL